MKASKYGDHWRTVRGKHYPIGVSKLSVMDEKTGVNTQFCLSGNTAICGANGSGKSSLLKLFSNNRNAEVANLSLVEAVEWKPIAEDRSGIHYLSPPEKIGWLLAAMRDSVPLEIGERLDFLAAYDKGNFSKADIEQINYVLATNIEQISVYEIEFAKPASLSDYEEERASDDEEVFPYFLITRDGDELFSEDLSHGELCVLYIYWLLSQKIAVPAAVLIDEPESYLCPRSQYRMADVLAYLSSKRCIQLILATHSHCFIERIGIESTLIAGIIEKRIGVTKPLHASHSFHSLGYSFREDKWVLLEDHGAARFFNNLFKATNLHWLRDRKLVALHGESDITEILKRIPTSLDVIGIYDGDQRNKVPDTVPTDMYRTLPGNEPPEVLLINHIDGRRVQYAQKLGMKTTDVEAAMQKVRGVDHHDYFRVLSRELEFDLDVDHGAAKLFDDAFGLWLSDERNRVAAYQFVAELDSEFAFPGAA